MASVPSNWQACANEYTSHMTTAPSLPIQTKRFVLRDFSRADEQDFVRYQTDPAFSIHHTADETGLDHASWVFQRFIGWQAEKPRTKYQFAICHIAEDGRVIGSCGIRMEEPQAETADFGIELARPYWGRYRFAAEVSESVIDWAFHNFPLNALTADTAVSNRVAARLAEEAGFTLVSVEEKQYWRLERGRWTSLSKQ